MKKRNAVDRKLTFAEKDEKEMKIKCVDWVSEQLQGLEKRGLKKKNGKSRKRCT